MHKKVLLLAVSCKTGGLCPGGLDLDNPSQWIRIVANDGRAGAVQGCDIDFAKPLDLIEFDGTHMPQGIQRENWVINNNSCENKGRFRLANGIGTEREILDWAFQRYGYHGFWNNFKSFLNEQEFKSINAPSESIMKVTDILLYKNEWGKAKIDFCWEKSRFPIKFISLTDQDFYARICNGPINFADAYIVTSIPKSINDYIDPETEEKKAYKFVSKVYEIQ